ncbi:hypothetical protein L1285_21070 [Pseudoalteromonas sp. DL2-H2.2]|uniref:hypothetical protein n=1 Tax=Pseudoalteromonas sp. DL2-H2.2 TaxID=2908889 RepID=UPI001F1923AF|nr:hypothetical protein [Pseudoalteromonas sp. DL2-H2.2]MCF2910804.1 hypothetical protein [Pseudoalteromonas sp. DL2-H2.2]
MITISFSARYEILNSPVNASFNTPSNLGGMLRFTQPYEINRAPVTVTFDGGTEPPDTRKLIGIYVASSWAGFKSVSLRESFNWSRRNQVRISVSLTTSKMQPVAVYKAITNTQKQSLVNRAGLIWSTSKRVTEHYPMPWFAQSIRSHTSVGWVSSAKTTSTRIFIAYAPRKPEYVCVWKNHPKPGLTFLNFESGFSPAIALSFSEPEKVCYWGLPGGLVRSDDDLPTLDRKLPIEPQIRRAYIMQPTITCKRLSDNTDILITSFSHAFERGQFAATGSIRFCSRIDMERAMGQELLVNVNGYEYVVICEQPSTSNKFNSASYSASIRGRFAQLSAPYARETNYTNPTPRTLAGIMSDALTNTGWTLDNQMIDYPIPKGAYSYRGLTPASALLRIAQSVGGILDFDDVSKTVSVIPEWPVAPWDTHNAVCDVILNDSLILEHNTRQTVSPEHTAVFVRGEQQGVACKIKRAGTLGDQYAYDVVDSLITDNQAARQRGTCELARSGSKKVSEIRTKLTAALPPIRPGMLIGIRYSDSLYKATCDSASISASINAQGAITVNQSIRVVANV